MGQWTIKCETNLKLLEEKLGHYQFEPTNQDLIKVPKQVNKWENVFIKHQQYNLPWPLYKIVERCRGLFVLFGFISYFYEVQLLKIVVLV